MPKDFYYPVAVADGTYTVASTLASDGQGAFTTGRAAQAYADRLNASHDWSLRLSVRGNREASRLS